MTRDDFLARPENWRLRELADPAHPDYREEFAEYVEKCVRLNQPVPRSAKPRIPLGKPQKR